MLRKKFKGIEKQKKIRKMFCSKIKENRTTFILLRYKPIIGMAPDFFGN